MTTSAIASNATLTELAGRVRARSLEIEAARRLPLDLVTEFEKANLFRMCLPGSLGGPEATPQQLVETIETISIGDGSAGWCVMIGATTSLISAYLDPATAAEIFVPGTTTGGVFAPTGKAVARDGGYVVNGRWAFASGCQHCTWLMGGCVVLDDDQPRRTESGLPYTPMLLFPAGEAEILDTWNVSGLRGTGSHDIVVRDLFVPAERAVALITDTPRASGALYRFPAFGLLAIGISAVALGIARRAIEEFLALAVKKSAPGGKRTVADRPVVQTHVARAEALVRSARALLFESLDQAWEQAESGAPLTPAHRASLRLAATNATEASVRATDLMYTAAGGTAIYADSPLQRCLRDVHVASQHIMVAEPTYETIGRVLLGIDGNLSQL